MKKLLYVFFIIASIMMVQSCDKLNYYFSSKPYTVSSLPMVHLQDSTKYLINPNKIVSTEIEDSVNYYLSKLEHEKGVQTVYAIVNYVDRPDNLAEFCTELGNKYGIGNKDDRGLIVIVSVEQHKWFIAPGRGLESELPDITCNHIGKDFITDNMKGKHPHPDVAVLESTKALYYKIAKNSDYTPPINWTNVIICIIGFILFVIIIFIVNSSGTSGGSFRGGSFSGSGTGGGSFGGGSFGGGGAGGGW